MTILSLADPAADLVCALPVNDARDRLRAIETMIGDRLDSVTRIEDRLRIRIARDGLTDLDADAIAFAEAEKECCAFLGFAVESEPGAVTIEISAPAGAEPTLEGIEWLVRAAGGRLGAV
jgi:hypothetical protein